MWEADLLKDGSFDNAAKDCSAIIHMASPFTLHFKNAKKELIVPALEGTKNVLRAANKTQTVKKVILTSSVAAIYGDNIDMYELNISEFTEKNFNYSSSASHQPYSYSKTIAEKEAWKIYNNQDQWELIVINPSFVMGPSLTNRSRSESLRFMTDLLTGKYFLGAPDLMFGFVDVRDVAKAHIIALENKNTKGRNILAERTINVYELSKIIKKLYGKKYKLPLMQTPKFILYLVGWLFNLSPKFISRNVGYDIKLNTTKSKENMKLTYTPLENTLKDMIEQMETNKQLNKNKSNQ